MEYCELITIEKLFFAWDEFKRGKQGKKDVMEFERNLEDHIFALQEELVNKTYTHGAYHTFHIWDPKHRVINKAEVRDRVVHHLLFNYLEPIWQPRFIHQSYSCQKDKGVHLGVEEVSRALRKITKNYTRGVFVLKLDIKKFFDSIDHEVLLGLLRVRVHDMDILWLLERIVRSFSSGRPGKGVPIGNLTSQIFANVYLNELDYFVKHRLKVRYYFRYADDFVLLHEDRNYLETMQGEIAKFLWQRLSLTLHPRKIILKKFRQGIDFLGYVLRPHYRVLRTKTKQRMFKKTGQRVDVYNRGEINEYALNQTLQSYLGMLSHCNGHRMEEQLKNEIWYKKMPVAPAMKEV